MVQRLLPVGECKREIIKWWWFKPEIGERWVINRWLYVVKSYKKIFWIYRVKLEVGVFEEDEF